MRKGLLVAGIALAGFGAFAATGLGGTGGGEDPKLRTGPPVKLERERASAVEAQAAGAVAAHRRHRFRVRYFTSPVISVPPLGATELGFMTCPRRWAAISGFFATDRGVVADHFFSPPAVRRWEFGFIDLTGQPGQAQAGIVCARIR